MEIKRPLQKQLKIRICIDKADRAGFSGSVWAVCLKEPFYFHDVHQFLLKLDRIFDFRAYPQAFQRRRTFSGRKAASVRCVPEAHGLEVGAIRAAHGSLSTWNMLVLSRRCTTWQGFLTRSEEHRRIYFDSELDLIRTLLRTGIPHGRTSD